MATSSCPACGGSLDVPFHVTEGVPANSCLLLESGRRGPYVPARSARAGALPGVRLHHQHVGFNSTLLSTRPATRRPRPSRSDSARSLRFGPAWVEGNDLARRPWSRSAAARVSSWGWSRPGSVAASASIRGSGSASTRRRAARRRPGARRPWPHGSRGRRRLSSYAGAHHDVEDSSQPCARHRRRRRHCAFELPDSRRVFDEVAFWDIYYEHCSYFTPGSLARLFRERIRGRRTSPWPTTTSTSCWRRHPSGPTRSAATTPASTTTASASVPRSRPSSARCPRPCRHWRDEIAAVDERGGTRRAVGWRLQGRGVPDRCRRWATRSPAPSTSTRTSTGATSPGPGTSGAGPGRADRARPRSW